MNQHKSTLEHLPFGALKINERVQRRLIPSSVRKLTGEWDLEKVGVVTVSIRGDVAYVIDGQHRIRAAMDLGLGETKVKCHVYRDLTPKQEAELFLALNDSKTVSAYDRFTIGLAAGDPRCVEVRDTLARHGLRISDQNHGDGAVACVEAIMRLASRGTLDECCAVLVSAWGTRASAYERTITAGLGVVLGHYNGELDRPALIQKLSGYPGGPAALRGDARGLADYKPMSLTRAAAELMVDTYNKGRRAGRLAPLP